MKLLSFFFLFILSCTATNTKNTVHDTKKTDYSVSCDTSNFNVFNYLSEDKISRFSNEIYNFAEKDLLLSKKDSLIVFVGSSSIRKWYNLEEDFGNLPVINRGFGGSTFPELIFYSNELIFKYKPLIVVIYEGDNDQYILNPQQIFECACYLEQKIHNKLPQTEVYFISIKPSPSRINMLKTMLLTNNLLKNLATTTPNTHYIDVWSSSFKGNKINGEIFKADSLHLNDKGYQIWYDSIYPTINQKYLSIIQ